MFENRTDAGIQLAEKLLRFKNENSVVLAIPGGGLPLGAIVAKTLNAPLDVVLTKKIGHSYHKEYAIGAVSLEDLILTDSEVISQTYIDKEVKRIRNKLRERHNQYFKNRSPKILTDFTVIVVDDGIATGNTLLASIAMIRKQKPRKIIIAIPVAPTSIIGTFQDNPHIDEIICLLVSSNFRAVGQFYREFEQVSDQEAIQLLEGSYAPKKPSL